MDHCGLCDAPVAASHRHVLNTRDGGALCACAACCALFKREALGFYRLIPDRRVRVPGDSIGALNLPVGLAFLVKLADGRVVAHSPSPLGTTDSMVDARAWSAVESGSPVLAGLRTQVEAFVVHNDGRTGPQEQWLLPIDDCFRLVALVRRHWRGIAGGPAVWREVARFFARLRPSHQ